ncbi:hypothetical protein KC361_g278 [Hortaea werneckii]|nr:hypothetical protein KC361_g278 [Hortaea werneckii]
MTAAVIGGGGERRPKARKGTNLLNPLLAITAIPFLPLDATRARAYVPKRHEHRADDRKEGHREESRHHHSSSSRRSSDDSSHHHPHHHHHHHHHKHRHSNSGGTSGSSGSIKSHRH